MKTHCKKHIDESENDLLYARLLAGEDVRDLIITGNMSMVIAIVGDFVRDEWDYLRDDLTSEGFLALTVAADAMLRTPIRNPTAYLSQAIRHAISLAARHSPYTPADVSLRVFRTGNTVDLQDALSSCCDTPLDLQILSLRSERRTFTDIATILGLARRTVIDAFHRIHGTYHSQFCSSNDM